MKNANRLLLPGSIIALVLFGLVDALGVLAVFSYEIYQKIKEYQTGE